MLMRACFEPAAGCLQKGPGLVLGAWAGGGTARGGEQQHKYGMGSAGLAVRMRTGMGRLCQPCSHFPGDLKVMVLPLQNGDLSLHNVVSAT